jgi:hypothetical protein
VLAENRQVITMITDHWPVTRRDQSGAYLTIHARLPQPLGDKPRASPAAGRVPPPASPSPFTAPGRTAQGTLNQPAAADRRRLPAV